MNNFKSNGGILADSDTKYLSLHALLANIKKLTQRYQRTMSRSHLTSATPPSSSTIVFILLCCLWYTTSALSSNTGKAILTQFRYPITLTFIQFGFVATYCLLFMSPIIRFTSLRMPTRVIIQNTLPMGIFQVVGHMFSSIAISRIPVSTVHTIKVPLKRLFFLSLQPLISIQRHYLPYSPLLHMHSSSASATPQKLTYLYFP